MQTTTTNTIKTNTIKTNTENERNNIMTKTIKTKTIKTNTIKTNTENELEAVREASRIESGESVIMDAALFEAIGYNNESENDNMESKTWNEPYFLDSTGASKVLKEWADRTSASFFEEHSDIGNIHPDYTAVRVPVRFHRELRKLGMARDYRSSGTYLWEGVWYFPADREFLELIDSE